MNGPLSGDGRNGSEPDGSAWGPRAWGIDPVLLLPLAAAVVAGVAVFDLVGATVAVLLAGAWTVVAARRQRRRQELVDLREQGLASVTHELRTPLAQILLYGETLAMGGAPAATRDRAADVIVREARRLAHVVDDSLELAWIRRTDAPLAVEPVDLVALVDDVTTCMQPLAGERGARLVSPSAKPVTIHGDARVLRRALVAMLENALRYGPEGQTIRVEVGPTDTGVFLRVDDEGPGVPETERHDVWEPYRRGSTATGTTGTGVGLALVRHGVAAHGGHVRLSCAPGGGARFEVHLPSRPGGG